MNTYLLISTGLTSQKFELEKGCSLFAGSGPNSRIVLNGSGIHEIHCRFWMDLEGAFWVQDWNTGKTFVNKTPIENEVHLNSGDIVSIGNFSIVPVLDERAHERLNNAGKDASVDNSTQAPVVFPEPTTELTTELTSNSDSIDEMLEQTSKLLDEEITPQLANATNPEPNQVPTDSIPTPVETYDGEAFVYDVNGADETDAAFFDSNLSSPTAFGIDEKFGGFETDSSQPIDQNEAEMLQLEVEQLRFELSERNAQLTRFLDSQSKVDPIDDEQTAKLVNRLEELLAELESSDSRVRGLEELL
ncbi:MAG: putative component of type VI protein secretion system, partial [Mariniblastus sp.]